MAPICIIQADPGDANIVMIRTELNFIEQTNLLHSVGNLPNIKFSSDLIKFYFIYISSQKRL